MLSSIMSRKAGSGSKGADETALWAAVENRDARADGTFVFSVATTGIYCRPSCPSRRARRENIRFHRTPEEAEAAGFRACKRCKPDRAGNASDHMGRIEAACRQIEDAVDAGDPVPGLAELAGRAKLSRFHFHRVFKDVMGVTPRTYAAARKARLMRDELAANERVTDAIYSAGYGSASRFYESATARLGMAASAYRDGGRGATIRFAVGECSLGSILVASTQRGVCRIAFGDDPQLLVDELERSFPKATLIGADAGFEALVATVVGFVEQPAGSLDLPLDVKGTAFQERVWQALRLIPLGTTATYADLAARIGNPKAVRAVAQACAANPVALAIPCHRVVRLSGDTGGYRWGVERKRALLDREAA